MHCIIIVAIVVLPHISLCLVLFYPASVFTYSWLLSGFAIRDSHWLTDCSMIQLDSLHTLTHSVGTKMVAILQTFKCIFMKENFIFIHMMYIIAYWVIMKILPKTFDKFVKKGHCWGYTGGTLASLPSCCNSVEDQVYTDEIQRY